MKKRFFLFLVVSFSFLFLVPDGQAVYKAKKTQKEERPSFKSPEEERLYRLRHGEVLTDGGYLKKGVWGRMEGVIQAPTDVVWKLFLDANAWKRYGLPTMADSRAVTGEIAHEVESSKKVEDFYQAIGTLVVDPMERRRKGGIWENYTFQHYDLPWPVANKWMIVKNINDETGISDGIYRGTWTKAAGNVRSLEGEIRLEPFEGDRHRTLMLYSVKSDPGSTVPKFLLKWAVKKSMPQAIRVIRREAAKISRPSAILQKPD